MNIVSVKTFKGVISPLAYRKSSVAFFRAAVTMPKDEFVLPPIYLHCLSIELGLKCLLLLKGVGPTKLKKKYGHKLRKLAREVMEETKFRLTLKIGDADAFDSAASVYESHRARYFEPADALGGFKEFPDRKIIADINRRLIEYLEQLVV